MRYSYVYKQLGLCLGHAFPRNGLYTKDREDCLHRMTANGGHGWLMLLAK